MSKIYFDHIELSFAKAVDPLPWPPVERIQSKLFYVITKSKEAYYAYVKRHTPLVEKVTKPGVVFHSGVSGLKFIWAPDPNYIYDRPPGSYVVDPSYVGDYRHDFETKLQSQGFYRKDW